MRARRLGKSNSFIADRDESRGQWGGGYWIEKCPDDDFESFGIGFSGLPEVLDALLCLCVLVAVGLISGDRASSLARESHSKVAKLFAESVELEII